MKAGDVKGALRFAEGIKDTEVHLFSDGRFPDIPDFALGNLLIHFHTAGKTEREDVTPDLLGSSGQSERCLGCLFRGRSHWKSGDDHALDAG